MYAYQVVNMWEFIINSKASKFG